MRWTDLARKPEAFQLELTVEQTRRRVYQLAQQTRQAAGGLIAALADLARPTAVTWSFCRRECCPATAKT